MLRVESVRELDVSQGAIHQFSDSVHPADAITSYGLLLQKWLHKAGYRSELYAETIHPALHDRVRPLHRDRAQPDERLALYHHSIGSAVASHLLARPGSLGVIYHNVTPPEFLAGTNPALAAKLAEGRAQLAPLAARAALGIAVSAYNEADLRAAGFDRTTVLPLALDEARLDQPPVPQVEARLAEGEWLLFVGRLVPNKRQDALVTLLYHIRRRRPSVKLALVGELWDPIYTRWVRHQIDSLGLEEAVWLAGRVSPAELVSFYRGASLYVSMSEHEGVGLPLIESMWMGPPVLAYASSGVPGTLGGAGVLFHEQDFPTLAELVSVLLDDTALRARLIAGQHRRAEAFRERHVRQQFLALVTGLAERGNADG